MATYTSIHVRPLNPCSSKGGNVIKISLIFWWKEQNMKHHSRENYSVLDVLFWFIGMWYKSPTQTCKTLVQKRWRLKCFCMQRVWSVNGGLYRSACQHLHQYDDSSWSYIAAKFQVWKDFMGDAALNCASWILYNITDMPIEFQCIFHRNKRKKLYAMIPIKRQRKSFKFIKLLRGVLPSVELMHLHNHFASTLWWQPQTS